MKEDFAVFSILGHKTEWHTHTEYYFASKKNKLMWQMELEDNIPKIMSQTHMIIIAWFQQHSQPQISNFLETENRMATITVGKEERIG